jgi:pimeloyl-ACP methyl ester carboxylesterase
MRHVAFALGVVVAALTVLALGFALADRASWSGYSYTFGMGVIAAGLLNVDRKRRSALMRTGLGLLLLIALVRLSTASRGPTVTLTTTASGGARWLARLVDEGDVTVAGSYLLVALHLLHDPDAPAVPAVLKEAYRTMRAAEGDVPSPMLPTYAGLESPAHSDIVIVEPALGAEGTVPPTSPNGAFIFLHGFAGGFTLPCWEVARMAAHAGLVTYCPSVGWRGDWWTPAGEQTLRETVRLVRARGIDSIYLAGLSNGAVGAARLASRMYGTFRGLILIAGAAANAPSPRVPVLVVQGRHDGMMPAAIARAYATTWGATYVDLDAGHFALLVRHEEAERAISSWLVRH